MIRHQYFLIIAAFVGGVLHLIISLNHNQLIFNDGVAFGIGSGRSIIIINLFVLLLTFYVFLKVDTLYRTQLLLIFIGGVFNFIDRVIDGTVVDYIDLQVSLLPVFNINDVIISIGVIYLIILMIKDYGKNRGGKV